MYIFIISGLVAVYAAMIYCFIFSVVGFVDTKCNNSCANCYFVCRYL